MKKIIFSLLLILLLSCGSDASQVGVGAGLYIPTHGHKNANDGGILFLASGITSSINLSSSLTQTIGNVTSGDIIMTFSRGDIFYTVVPTYAALTLVTSGTATVTSSYGATGLISATSGQMAGSVTNIIKVTASGTLAITNNISNTGGSISTYGNYQTYMFLLRQ